MPGDPGDHKVGFSGQVGHPSPRLTLWTWAERDLMGAKIPLPAACSEPAMPQYRAETEQQGVRISTQA